MSDIKNIKDGAVTSIADTDLVMCSVGGTYHPISFANLMAAVRCGIQVGGRNLIPDSAKFTGWSMKTQGHVADGTSGIFSVRKSAGDFRGGYRMCSFVAGNWYTFSILTNKPADMTLYIKYVNDNCGVQTASFSPSRWSTRQISEEWHMVSVSCLCTNSGSAVIEYETLKIGIDKTVRFCAPKLEFGNIATGWSPAPEDLASMWGG